MADGKIIKALDKKLMEDGVIDPAYAVDYAKVHRMLNGHIHKHGAGLPQEVFSDVEKKMREWLDTLSRQGASQEKLTSYLRCGLAHLSFDYIDSGYVQIASEDLVARAMISFKQRNYHKSYYKPSAVSSSATKKGKAGTAVKSSAKKKGKIKAIKRKPVQAGKKTATKKTSAKSGTKQTKKGIGKTKKRVNLTRSGVSGKKKSGARTRKPGSKKRATSSTFGKLLKSLMKKR